MAEMLELSLLGTVAIRQNGEPVGGQVSAKSQALLCYLAVTAQPHSREKLAGLLWGDKSEESAKANLRKSLSNLGQLVGDALIIDRQTVTFNRKSPYWLDVEVFEICTDMLYWIGDLPLRTGQAAAVVEYLTFVQYHSATDNRVRREVGELLEKLAAGLPPEILGAAQARGHARTLEELMTDVLDQLGVI